MASRPISTAKFAEAIAERLIDGRTVAALCGFRSRQTLYNRIEAGTLPEPILKLERGYAFWDRLAVIKATRTRR